MGAGAYWLGWRGSLELRRRFVAGNVARIAGVLMSLDLLGKQLLARIGANMT